jgi:hypothetical protein
LVAAVCNRPEAWPDGFGLALLDAPRRAIEEAGGVDLLPILRRVL